MLFTQILCFINQIVLAMNFGFKFKSTSKCLVMCHNTDFDKMIKV